MGTLLKYVLLNGFRFPVRAQSWLFRGGHAQKQFDRRGYGATGCTGPPCSAHASTTARSVMCGRRLAMAHAREVPDN